MPTPTALPLLLALCPTASAGAPAVEPLPVASGARVVERWVHPAYAVPRGTTLAAPAPEPAGVLRASGGAGFFNNRWSGGWVDLAPGGELVDWGVKPDCGSTDLVSEIALSVRTTQLAVDAGGPGYRIGMRLWVGTSGPDPGSLGTLVAEYELAGDYGCQVGQPSIAFTDLFDPPTLVRVPPGPIGWSYFLLEDETDPLTALTTGSACASLGGAADPTTGTHDCLGSYLSPAGAGTFVGAVRPTAGGSSLLIELRDEAPFPANNFVTNAGSNPMSYTAERGVVGSTWHGTVDLTTTGHAFALVVGFQQNALLTLGGGQVLLVADGGGGEILGLAPRPGPRATFSIAVPALPFLSGFYVATQALHFGGGIPFALSNRVGIQLGNR